MELRHRKTLQSSRSFLKMSFIPNVDVLSYLLGEQILTETECEEINALNEYDNATKMLFVRILLHKDSSAFEVFLDALDNTGQKHVKLYLKKTLECIPQDIESESESEDDSNNYLQKSHWPDIGLSDRYKNVLLNSKDYLKKHLIVNVDLVVYLYSQEVLTTSQCEHFFEQDSYALTAKCHFVAILLHKDDRAFGLFLTGLEISKQEYVKQYLLQQIDYVDPSQDLGTISDESNESEIYDISSTLPQLHSMLHKRKYRHQFDILRTNALFIIQKLLVNDSLLGHLYGSYVLTIEQFNNLSHFIDKEMPRNKLATKLLLLIICSGKADALAQFIRGLELTKQDHIKHHILEGHVLSDYAVIDKMDLLCSGVSRLYVKKEILPELKSPEGPEKITKLIKYNDIGTMKAVIDCGYSKETIYSGGKTLLHMVARGGGSDMMKFMLKAVQPSVNVNFIDNYGTTPLMESLISKNDKACRVILREGDIDVHAVNKKGEDALMLACRYGNANAVFTLVEEKQASVLTKDRDGMTALILAIKHAKNQEIPELLLTYGADINAEESVFGKTPLMYANQSPVLTRLLLSHGAVVNMQSARYIHGSGGRTALMFAASNLEVTTILVEHGADVNVEDMRRNTALMESSSSPEVTAYLLDQGAQVNARNIMGGTALIHAVSNVQVTRILLDKGAQVNSCNKNGKTALMWACDSPEVTSLLLTEGASVNTADRKRKTALMYACYNPAVTKILLDFGANIRARSKEGKTALDYAETQIETRKVLQKHLENMQ